jgi:hypothetical protein
VQHDIAQPAGVFALSRTVWLSVARSMTTDDVGGTCRQIESDQSPRYTAAAARALRYRVRLTIRPQLRTIRIMKSDS